MCSIANWGRQVEVEAWMLDRSVADDERDEILQRKMRHPLLFCSLPCKACPSPAAVGFSRSIFEDSATKVWQKELMVGLAKASRTGCSV